MTERLIERICRAIDALMAACLALMVVMVFGNVVLRYAFNSGIAVSEELSRWLFVWMTFLGAIVALRDHGHLGSDMLVRRLSPTGRRACLVLGHLMMLWINWLLLTGSLAQSRINIDVEAPVTGLPMAVIYAAGVVFASAASVLILRNLWRALSGAMSADEMIVVRESEDLGPAHANDPSASRS